MKEKQRKQDRQKRRGRNKPRVTQNGHVIKTNKQKGKFPTSHLWDFALNLKVADPN